MMTTNDYRIRQNKLIEQLRAIDDRRASNLPDPGYCDCRAKGSWAPGDVVHGTSGTTATVWSGCPMHSGRAIVPTSAEAYARYCTARGLVSGGRS